MIFVEKSTRSEFDGWLVLLALQQVFNDFSFWMVLSCIHDKHENTEFT